LEWSDEEIRIEAIKRYIEGEKQVDICENLGKSKSWLKKWLKRYRTGSNEWFKEHSKRPHTSNNKINDRIEAVVVNVRESLMEGSDVSTKYSFVGAEAIQFQM